MSREAIIRYSSRVLAAPGANTNFPAAGFGLKHHDSGIVVVIDPTSATVVNLRSTDGTTAYDQELGIASAGVLTPFAVPRLAKQVSGVEMTYYLRIETDSVVRSVDVVELPADQITQLTAQNIAAAIVANPPTIVVTDPAPLQLTTTLVGINDTVAQNQWTASVAVSLGGTYSGVIRDLYLAQYEDGTGAILTDMYGRLAIFDTDPAIAIGSTTLTAAQAAKLVDEIAWTNAELVSDTNSARLIARIEKYLASGTTFYVAFFWQGLTSINSAAGDDERLVLRCAFERIT